MLTLLLISLLRKLWIKSIKNKFTVLLTACSFFSSISHAQPNELNYKVVQGGKEIGWISLKKNTSGQNSTIFLVSEVKKRIIFEMSVNETMESEFKNALLIKSTCLRKINGEITANKQLIYNGKSYELIEDGKRKLLSIMPISNNLLTIYFQEPINIGQVYSDNFQCILNIEKKSKGEYKISLPDGNENYYYYTNGVCSRVIVNHPLYSIEFILTAKTRT